MNFDDEGFEFELKEFQKITVHKGEVWCIAWKPTAEVDEIPAEVNDVPAGVDDVPAKVDDVPAGVDDVPAKVDDVPAGVDDVPAEVDEVTAEADDVPAIFASCGEDMTCRIFEYGPNVGFFQRKTVLEHTEAVRFCSWSPSGKLLAIASHDATALWEENAEGTFVRIATLKKDEGDVICVAWNSSGTSLATCGMDRKVMIWDVAVPSEVKKPYELNEESRMVQWHPLHNTLFSGHHGVIKVWEMDSEGIWQNDFNLTDPDCGPMDYTRVLSFNATGDKMVTYSNDTIKIWGRDITEEQYKHTGYWKILFTLQKHCSKILSVHWSRQGIISCGALDDNGIWVFVESEAGLAREEVGGATYRLLLKKEEAHGNWVIAGQWSPKEIRRLASACCDGTIKIWDLVSSPR